ncbi:hypothetical protein BZM26_25330 [Paraburkholderia strydomiana]|nr:hypothetical protein BZM26_25330 [Paraburkholderia strydomiana]
MPGISCAVWASYTKLPPAAREFAPSTPVSGFLEARLSGVKPFCPLPKACLIALNTPLPALPFGGTKL